MKREVILLSIVLAAMSGWCLAEGEEEKAAGAGTAAAEGWRKQAPKLPAPGAFKLPKIDKFKLANGLQVELVEDHRVPYTTIACGIKAGSVYNPKDQEGLSNLVASMVNEGTAKHNSKELAEAIDFIGGSFNAGTGPDFTTISASALSQYNEKLMSFLSEVLTSASFPEDELKLKKTNLIQQLKMARSKPEFLGNERFAKVVFGQHPYSIVAPKPEVVEKVSRQQLVDYYKKTYIPNDAYLVVVGDFKSAEMKTLIEKYFGDWKSAPEPKPELAALPRQSGRMIYLVNRPGSVQTRFKMGNVAIKKTDPDFYSMTVANQILGGAATSRLFINIRENKGYTYGAYSKISPQKEPGSFAAEAEVRTDVTAPALQEFIYEIERIRNLPPGEKELAATKNYLVGSFQLGLESQSGLAQKLLEGELYQLPENYLETYGNKIMAVTPSDVRQVARKYIDLDNLVITAVGDAEKIKAALEYFAPVTIYDTEGKLVSGPATTKSAGGS